MFPSVSGGARTGVAIDKVRNRVSGEFPRAATHQSGTTRATAIAATRHQPTVLSFEREAASSGPIEIRRSSSVMSNAEVHRSSGLRARHRSINETSSFDQAGASGWMGGGGYAIAADRGASASRPSNAFRPETISYRIAPNAKTSMR
jgi:hypothetical protein